VKMRAFRSISAFFDVASNVKHLQTISVRVEVSSIGFFKEEHQMYWC